MSIAQQINLIVEQLPEIKQKLILDKRYLRSENRICKKRNYT